MRKNSVALLFILGFWVSPARADLINSLDATLRAACPQINGVSIGNPTDKSTWIISYAPGATCQTAAQAALNSFSYTAPSTPPTSLQITSTSYPALNGYYPIDPMSQQKIQGLSLYVAVNGKFPAGQSTQPWPDISGTFHQFPTIAEWQAFATAMGDFVALVYLGQSPSQPVTIP